MLGPCLRHDEPPGVSLCIFPIKAFDGDCRYIIQAMLVTGQSVFNIIVHSGFCLLNKETRSMAVEHEE